MKLVTYEMKEQDLMIQAEPVCGRVGWIEADYVVDISFAQEWATFAQGLPLTLTLPSEMIPLLQLEERGRVELERVYEATQGFDVRELTVEGEPIALSLDEVELSAPLPNPAGFRDFYAFEQHVKTSRAKRELEMIAEWYQIPVFYFSNHRSILGPYQPLPYPQGTKALDYELEIGCVIGKRGKNIKRTDAHSYIAGFCIVNDWSARDVQRQEMKVGLGPAKGKDFATSIGPYLVTLDEVEEKRSGEHWNLQMEARINGSTLSRGNVKDLYWSFAQMIERASIDCELIPGDLIGSGTVGTGCILELGTEVHPWISPGDIVELEIEKLGVLKTEVV
ncbi:fumarylacetoacetate hydrolase family protein [Mechercharimyces sp. CAU 1602]|uniref:fumarylacetoacetate hydrolase family protein n=1 Tax=Mechercharimyces sp. CAU 1602 TaxID=2973933 RepID=UPI0021618F46|nr:fumarylacetoacetate hydrolase family protein [Mechercharimyces sp. CAU 1602]MCS1350032.1 fumarylacetoacetate hydrolase family protein [Mechercharimyces sp. CAU 1602]